MEKENMTSKVNIHFNKKQRLLGNFDKTNVNCNIVKRKIKSKVIIKQ